MCDGRATYIVIQNVSVSLMEVLKVSHVPVITIPVYCIVFRPIHVCSAAHSMSLSEVLPTTEIDTVSEFTRRSTTDNCK